MQYRIIVTSVKGGVGKSTTAAYLAHVLSERGKRVLLCDLDLGSRCLDMFFGAEEQAVYDFGDIYRKTAEPSRAIISCGGVSLCPSSLTLGADEVSPERLTESVCELAESMDAEFVICDTSGTQIPSYLAKWANLALICSTQQPAALRGAENAARLLRKEGLSRARLVVTSFEYREAKRGERKGILGVIDQASVRALGVVPYDRELFISQEAGRMADKKSAARQAYENIAARLCGEERRLFHGIRGYKGKDVL